MPDTDTLAEIDDEMTAAHEALAEADGRRVRARASQAEADRRVKEARAAYVETLRQQRDVDALALVAESAYQRASRAFDEAEERWLASGGLSR